MDWYTEHIEEPVRDLVRLLRDNGFNTYNSCGHEMIVSMEWYNVEDQQCLVDLLLEHGYNKFVVETSWIFGECLSRKDMQLRIS